MKRTIALIALLSASVLLCKLAWKDRSEVEGASFPQTAGTAQPSADDTLRAKYPTEQELLDRVLREYHHNAIAIEQTDGLRGLVLLDRLGLEAVFLYEKYPREFRRLRDALTDTAAADVLLHWREYFAMKRASEVDRGILVAEIAQLSPSARRAAAKNPNALPLILAEPVGVTEMIERFRGDLDDLRDALVMLDFISLDHGAADLRAAIRVVDEHGSLAIEAFRLLGPEGFALVKLYGPVLEALGDALPLDDALIVLRVNSEDVDSLLASHGPETVAGYLRHIAAANLTAAVGGSPHALRFSAEFGATGDRALVRAGSDAADVVYEDYPDPVLRDRAVEALAEHGPMALAMLSKYATDADFRAILQQYGARVIPPLAQSDPAPEALAALRAKDRKSFSEALAQSVLAMSRDNGQATIRLIKADGIDRVESLNSTSVEYYQFLPLYDVIHLGRVLGRGHTPTGGELTWAMVDGCFVVADVLSLSALQPEGAVATEAARSEAKATVEQVAKSTSRKLAEDATEISSRVAAREGLAASAERLSKWWAVRMAGGTYALLRRVPEALGQLGAADVAHMSRAFCSKAGLRLSEWKAVRFLVKGQVVVRAIPPGRGVKYIGLQAVQAGVGIVAFQKMEEHLASRRP